MDTTLHSAYSPGKTAAIDMAVQDMRPKTVSQFKEDKYTTGMVTYNNSGHRQVTDYHRKYS